MPLASLQQRTHAIVIGGGIAGLLCARVLLQHFEQVTLIERDHYPTEPASRGGVPQGHHLHQMLMGGQQVMEQLFPGISAKLLAHGAVPYDVFADTVSSFITGRTPRFPGEADMRGYQCTRLLIEWQLQQELQGFEQVRILEGYEVVALLAGQQRASVGGVRMRKRSHLPPEQQEEETLDADLVVAACGRSSSLAAWLQQLGCEVPQQTIINSFLGYASRLYTPPDDPERTWKTLIIQGKTPQGVRGSAIQLVEGNRWMVVLAGVGRDYPPTDDEGFLKFARTIPDEELGRVLEKAQPLSKIYGYRRTENCFQHYERLRQHPRGLIVMGDAFCAFNPIYGQGMTVAAKEVQAIDTCLRTYKGADLERSIQRRLARVVATPWQLAAASDYRVPQVEGAKQSWIGKALHRYFDTITILIRTDRFIFTTFVKVLHLVIPPTALFHPRIAFSVLRHMRSAKKILDA